MRTRSVARLTLAAAVATLLASPLLPSVREAFAACRTWIQGLGPWGPFSLAVAYTPATLLLFPASWLTVGAGAAFGFFPAVVAVSAGSTTAAAVAFLLSRTLLRRRLEERLRRRAWFEPLDQAVAQSGFTLVLLCRLTPLLPFGPLNYAFGLTRVRFVVYVFASWLGMLPGTLVYTGLGAAAVAWSAVADAGQALLLLLGAAAALGATLLISRLARRALVEALPTRSEQGDSPGGAGGETAPPSGQGARRDEQQP
jgi:uncharacterized membrane protein YdjX (TVP38/TMEM64 family)